MIGATVGVDDGFAVLGLATVGDDRDRCGDAERGKRAFEAAVRLNGEICDGGHVISPESSGPIPDGAQGGASGGRSPSVSEGRSEEGRVGKGWGRRGEYMG